MRRRADVLRTVALVLVAALLVALVRGRLFEKNRRIKETSEVYLLPPPRQLVVLSLGYRAALADILWAHLLVSQGLHSFERRRYDNLTLLIDAINELDPTFRDPYRMADALVTFNIGGGHPVTPEDVRKVRSIMERGVQNRPLDADMWLGLGEFVAFIAPGTYLTDPDEQQRWRVDGARMLGRAAELSGDQANIAWQAIGGARFLGRAGEIDAEIRFLERIMATTDDAELRQKARAHLERVFGARFDDLVAAKRRRERLELLNRLEQGVWDLRHTDVPYVTRRRYMVFGPPREPARCAGPGHAFDPQCALTWRDWEERSEAAR